MRNEYVNLIIYVYIQYSVSSKLNIGQFAVQL